MDHAGATGKDGWSPLPQVLARRLQAMILKGELAAGSRLPSQRVLSSRYAVSRASLREALLMLETLGLIRTEPGRGTFVVPRAPTPPASPPRWRYEGDASLQEVFEVRLMIEGRLAAAAAPQIDAASLAILRQATDEMERCWALGDLLANVEADLLFHRTLAAVSPNRLLSGLYNSILPLLNETQRQPIPRTEPRRMDASVAEHRALIAALERGDSTSARLSMEAHVRNTAQCAGLAV